jgi:integrase
LPARREDREYVFGRRAGAGFSGWSKAKKELDARIGALRKKAGIKQPMPPWTIHDLRRFFVTHLLGGRPLPLGCQELVEYSRKHRISTPANADDRT